MLNSTITKPNKKITYRIQVQGNKEVEVEASSAFAALGIHRKRGVNGLGKGWQLTRQPDGWIVAANRAQRVLEGGYHRLKEVNWTRDGDQSVN